MEGEEPVRRITNTIRPGVVVSLQIEDETRISKERVHQAERGSLRARWNDARWVVTEWREVEAH